MQAGAASMDVELHPLLPRRPFSWTAGAAARFRGSYNRRPWELRPKLELQPWMAGSCNRPPGELHAVNGSTAISGGWGWLASMGGAGLTGEHGRECGRHGWPAS
ncbi:hypothetical protein ACQJBY_072209 [Aegilops geniculata]